jgi:hypothetical protein
LKTSLLYQPLIGTISVIKVPSVLLAVCVAITGCATSSSDIASTYVSPLQYQSYDCDQLTAEAQRIQARVSQVGGRLDQAAANDKAVTGAGIILFWPALFFLGGTKQQEADYGRLKGEYDAVQQAAIIKKCNGLVPTVPKATPAAQPASSAT